MATTRPLIVLHPKYVDEIKSHPHLDFELATKKVGYTIFVTLTFQNIAMDTTLTLTEFLREPNCRFRGIPPRRCFKGNPGHSANQANPSTRYANRTFRW